MQKNTEINLQFKSRLGASGLKLTKNREAIFKHLMDSKAPLSVQEICNLTKRSSHFVSVYRSVDSLLKAGIIKQVPQGFKNKYELTDEFKPHHHHATCEICGKSREVNSGELEKLMEKLTREANLIPTKHHFEIYGICISCLAKREITSGA